MLSRLETMYLMAADFPIEAIRNQIAEAIDVVVHLGRTPDKGRKVLEIVEISGVKNGNIEVNPLFCYNNAGGLTATGNPLQNQSKLERKGIML
jgi:pilus assembly protein CpaF